MVVSGRFVTENKTKFVMFGLPRKVSEKAKASIHAKIYLACLGQTPLGVVVIYVLDIETH